MPKFTDADDAALIEAINARKPYREIAHSLGRTKNSVIGRAHRLAAAQPRGGWKLAPAKRATKPPKPPKRPAPPPPPMAAALPQEEAAPRWSKCLVAMRANECRWPYGMSNYRFCARRVVDGLPYCGFHARKAYRSPYGRED
jgi:GcrA cell cycle regulator